MPQQRLPSPYAPGKTLFCSITSPTPFGYSNGAACPLNQTGVIFRQRSRCMRGVTRDGLRGVVTPCSHAVFNGDIQLPPSTSTLCCCWYRVLSDSDTRVNVGIWQVMSESRESTWGAAPDDFCTWWPIEGERGACFKKSAAVHAPNLHCRDWVGVERFTRHRTSHVRRFDEWANINEEPPRPFEQSAAR